MDFNSICAGQLQVEFKDVHRNAHSIRQSVDIMIVDRTKPCNNQKCYILKNDAKLSDNDFESFKNGSYDFDKNDFFCIGDVLSINKHMKYIVLENKNTISYVHLIIAFGSHYSLLNYEFQAGVNTLVDAIRIRKKIPSAFAIISRDELKSSSQNKVKSSKKAQPLKQTDQIDSIQQKKIMKNITSSSRLLDSSKRLYEVQF